MEMQFVTRMHSSGMRTARLLTVSQGGARGGVCLGGRLPRGVSAWGGICPGGLPRGVDRQTPVKT